MVTLDGIYELFLNYFAKRTKSASPAGTKDSWTGRKLPLAIRVAAR
jgi:hypothetical protein